MGEFSYIILYCSNDELEEGGDPGSDSDFEIDTKKEVSSGTECVYVACSDK